MSLFLLPLPRLPRQADYVFHSIHRTTVLLHKFPWKFNFQKVKKCCVLLQLFSQNSRGSDLNDKADLLGTPCLGPRLLSKASAKVMVTGDYRCLGCPSASWGHPHTCLEIRPGPSWCRTDSLLLGAPQPAFQPRCFRSGAAGRGGAWRGGTRAVTQDLQAVASAP